MSAEISTWIDASGASTVLDVDWKASGRFMPEPAFETNGVPGQPGERLRAVRHGVHEFTIRLTLATADEGTLRTAQRQLVHAMDPARGDGILRVQSPLGDTREIPCRYVGGLGMLEEPGSSGPNMQQADVGFKAFEPYWRDASDISNTYTIGLTPTFFPIFPLRLTSSSIAVDTTITNNGDVETWPVFTIKGPGSTIILRNLTTGKMLQFGALSLATGESVSIDTRPGYKTATKSDGSNKFPDLTATSSLWPLVAGGNAVRLEMSGALAAYSSLQMAFRQKYLAP